MGPKENPNAASLSSRLRRLGMSDAGLVRAYRTFDAGADAFGLAEAGETARALGELPPVLLIWGIEGERFAAGAGLSPAVQSSLREVVEQVAAAVSAHTGSNGDAAG